MENIIVIGGGLMGCAAAWELSKYGEKVLLLEQQSKKFRGGSSYGSSRITRNLGPKKDIFAFVQKRTVEETRILINYLNGLDGKKKHQMKDVFRRSPVTYLYHKDQQADIDKLRYKRQKKHYKQGSGDEAFRKFGIYVPEDEVVVQEYNKYAGTLNPQALMKKLRQGIEKKGNKIVFDQKVVRIIKHGDYYELKVKNLKTGKSKRLTAKKVVLAAGPYTTDLLKNIAPYFKRLITPKKVALSFLQISKKRYKTLTKAEKRCIVNSHPLFDQKGRMYFSMVDKKSKDGRPIFKMGGHKWQNSVRHLDQIWKQKPLRKERKWAKKQFRKYIEQMAIPLRKKDIEYVDGYTCVYSVTPSNVPYVTHTFNKENQLDTGLVVIGGMSGTGAKGCLAYGQIAADMLLHSDESDRMYQRTKKILARHRWKPKKKRKGFL